MKIEDILTNITKKEDVYVKPKYDWRYENNINSEKNLLNIEGILEFKYDKWRTNSSLSNYLDTVIYANQMNINYHLSDKLHYHYLFHSVRKQKRYGKKKTEEDKKLEKLQVKEQELLSVIQDYYKYNIKKAKEALAILTKDQINIIIKSKGGIL